MLHLLAGLAVAATFSLDEGERAYVPVDDETGVVLSLPSPVRVITPSRGVDISALDGGEAGVRLLQVARRDPTDGWEGELVTLVLADGRTAAVQLIVGGRGADGFAELVLPPVLEPESPAGSGFLAAERDLMRAMLRDEGPGRTRVHEEMRFSHAPELSFSLERTWNARGLSGWTFIVRNETRRGVALHPEVLRIDRPSRLVLAAVDHETLAPCHEASPVRPCATVLRLVARQRGPSGGPDLGAGPEPFVRSVEVP